MHVNQKHAAESLRGLAKGLRLQRLTMADKLVIAAKLEGLAVLLESEVLASFRDTPDYVFAAADRFAELVAPSPAAKPRAVRFHEAATMLANLPAIDGARLLLATTRRMGTIIDENSLDDFAEYLGVFAEDLQEDADGR